MTILSRSKNDFNTCPDCHSLNSIIYNEDRAEQTCHECGFVVKDRIFDTSIADERYFNREERNRRARTGPPIPDHLSKIVLSTKLDRTNNWEQNRVFKQNEWSKEKLRSIHHALPQLRKICANLQLPSCIKNSAERLTIKALDKRLARGHTINGIVVASIFYACKGKNNLSLIDIVRQTKESIYNEKELRRRAYKCYTKIFQQLHLTSHFLDPISYIPRFISDLGLEERFIALAIRFYQNYTPYIGINGKDPKGIAAAVIYIICRAYSPISQKKVSEIAGITDATLRSRVKEFEAAFS